VIAEVAPAPALRPAGKPERDPGRTERVDDRFHRRRCRRPPGGPTGRRQIDTEPAPAASGPRRTKPRCTPCRPSPSSARSSSTAPPWRAGGCAGTCS